MSGSRESMSASDIDSKDQPMICWPAFSGAANCDANDSRHSKHMSAPRPPAKRMSSVPATPQNEHDQAAGFLFIKDPPRTNYPHATLVGAAVNAPSGIRGGELVQSIVMAPLAAGVKLSLLTDLVHGR